MKYSGKAKYKLAIHLKTNIQITCINTLLIRTHLSFGNHVISNLEKNVSKHVTIYGNTEDGDINNEIARHFGSVF